MRSGGLGPEYEWEGWHFLCATGMNYSNYRSYTRIGFLIVSNEMWSP